MMPVLNVHSTRGGWETGVRRGDHAPGQIPLNTLLCSFQVTARSVFDEEYLAALSARNEAVENHLIAQFSMAVRAKLRARLRSPELAEDAYQETFLRVLGYFRSGKTLNKPASLPGFIHGMCNNVALELLRQHTRQGQIPEHHQGPIDSSLNPQEQLVTEERKTIVRRLLEELPEKDRLVLRRIFLDEADKDVVCREFNIDRDYLRIVVFRARKRLRDVIEREEKGMRASAARR
ncbi:MAG TPA: sigma-70 family RNA polymerase sigma factor [Bryobacteraceae bacterium]|jgi:RNA polymerase sigma-70 factor (ECF subfamily)